MKRNQIDRGWLMAIQLGPRQLCQVIESQTLWGVTPNVLTHLDIYEDDYIPGLEIENRLLDIFPTNQR